MPEAGNIYTKYKENVCSCPICVDMCIKWRPCWGTAEEIGRIIEAGHDGRLMLVYYSVTDGGIPVQILSPAITGFENRFAPLNPFGRCTFMNQMNLCELHDPGLKPLEGRVASCTDEKPAAIMADIALTWETPLGEELVENWHRKLGN